MAFWFFMFLTNLLMPLMMLGFGKRFSKKPPNEINACFGYRTKMSMKNQDTWRFAHQYLGKIWCIFGWVLLPITVAVMLLTVGMSEEAVGTVGGILCCAQTVPMVGAIAPTEIALRKHFDENGKKR